MSTKKEILLRGLEIFKENPTRFLGFVRRYFLPRRKEYRKLFRMRLDEWLLYHQRTIGSDKCYWMGVRALKNPCDAWIYQEIIYEVKPDIIVELGSAEGGSTLYFAHLLDLMGKGTVISVDNDRRKYHVKHDRIIEVTGDTAAPETVEEVHKLCRDKSVLIVHDANHKKSNVLKDMQLYSPLVSVNSYLIVEDGIMDLFRPGNGIGSFEYGPLFTIDAFLRDNPNFVVDTERERYIITYNPKGFLRRMW